MNYFNLSDHLSEQKDIKVIGEENYNILHKIKK